jgi:hypothetical protein
MAMGGPVPAEMGAVDRMGEGVTVAFMRTVVVRLRMVFMVLELLP